MTRIFLILAICLSASGAIAQQTIVPGIWGCGGTFGCGGAPVHGMTGNIELDRAMAICDAHPGQSMVVTNPPSVDYAKPYDAACRKVAAEWDKSNAAEQEKARQAKNKADLDFLNGYAGKLP